MDLGRGQHGGIVVMPQVRAKSVAPVTGQHKLLMRKEQSRCLLSVQIAHHLVIVVDAPVVVVTLLHQFDHPLLRSVKPV